MCVCVCVCGGGGAHARVRACVRARARVRVFPMFTAHWAVDNARKRYEREALGQFLVFLQQQLCSHLYVHMKDVSAEGGGPAGQRTESSGQRRG